MPICRLKDSAITKILIINGYSDTTSRKALPIIKICIHSFKVFPFEPLDSAYLTVFAIRGQRENGERCLEQWPNGIYNHKGLRGFYIGSNNLGKIDDTISTLCYILEISDNPNIVFDASDICTAYARGQFHLIYDETQDIRNCQYIPTV